MISATRFGRVDIKYWSNDLQPSLDGVRAPGNASVTIIDSDAKDDDLLTINGENVGRLHFADALTYLLKEGNLSLSNVKTYIKQLLETPESLITDINQEKPFSLGNGALNPLEYLNSVKGDILARINSSNKYIVEGKKSFQIGD